MKKRHLYTLILVLTGVIAGPAPAEPSVISDRWHAVFFQGQRSGWMHETSTQGEGQITSEVEMRITIKRGPIEITVETANRYIETVEGRPVLISSTQKFAGQSMNKTVKFSDDGAVFESSVGAQTESKPLPDIGDDWLMPGAVIRYVRQQMADGVDPVTYNTFDPSVSLKPFGVTHKIVGKEEIEVFGRIAPAIKRVTTMEVMPGLETVDYITEQGENLKLTIDFGGISMEILSADRELALSEVDAPELMASTLVTTKTTIPDPRHTRRARFTLTSTGGDLPDLPVSSYQSVKRMSDRHAVLTIDLDAPASRSEEAPPVTHAPMIDGRDPRIVALVEDNGFDQIDDPAERAEAIRRFVHAYMTNADLSVGMGSASEVAQTRRGDCSEFAVLFAGMLRAAETPSRVATGLIYVDEFLGQKNIFGYHMWTQVWLDGRWVDLDATRKDDEPFDATHILLSTSNLDSEMHNDIIIMAQVIGQLDIQYTP